MLYTLATTLSQICEETIWEYGEAWVLNANSSVLELSQAWALKSGLEPDRALAWTQFQRCSQAFVLKVGEGLPGRVWAAQHPEWIVDTSALSEKYFLRDQIAKAFTVKAGLGLPICAADSIQAVLVFFMSQASSEIHELVERTQAIAAYHLLPN